MRAMIRVAVLSAMMSAVGCAGTAPRGPAINEPTTHAGANLPPAADHRAIASSFAPGSEQQVIVSRFDSLARAALAEYPVASLSLAVLHGSNSLLTAAYGDAEVSFGVPATSATLYHLIAPGVALLAAAVLRAAEQGRLSLEDDAAQYLPEFPWQGRRVSVRQLLDATSGLQDYHYLGDDYFRVARTPMRTDEVAALFGGRPFVHEPGAAWSWTISGFFLAGMILEGVTGEPYARFLQREVLTPAGLTGFVQCDDVRVIPGLARGYHRMDDGFGTDIVPGISAVRFTRAFCGSATDVAMLPEALRQLLKPGSYQALITPQGAAIEEGYGLGVSVLHEEGRRWWGGANSNLAGYGSSWLVFPDDSLIVVVLANAEVGMGRLGRNLARAALGLPLIPAPAAAPPLRTVASTHEEWTRVLGLYRMVPVDPPSPYRAWSETLCVYEEAGSLMGHYAGERPFILLKQEDSTYAMGSGRARLRFQMQDGRVTGAEHVGWSAGARQSETCGTVR